MTENALIWLPGAWSAYSRPMAAAAAPREDAYSDEALVEAIVKRGSQRHFRVLISRYKAKVHAIALSVLGPAYRSEADDVAQETFISVYQRLHTFRGESRFSTWLYRISFNTAIDHQRRARRHPSGSALEPADTAGPGGPESVHQDRQIARIVRRKVDTLPRSQKVIVHMHYWLGFKIREIAEILDCPEGTVKVYLLRARKRLAGALESVRGNRDE